jgi:hypothetical protein
LLRFANFQSATPSQSIDGRRLGNLPRLTRWAPLLLVVCGLTADHERRANACGWSPPEMAELTSFDPSVAGEGPDVGLEYDVNTAGVGRRCEECERTAMSTDWISYLGAGIDAADWEQALFHVNGVELEALGASLQNGSRAPATLAFVDVALKRDPGARVRLQRATRVVLLAREVQGVATLAQTPPPEEIARLLEETDGGITRAKHDDDAFITQRYTFLKLRVTFYARRWRDVQHLVASAPELAAPSQDLAWRARYYRAGALRRDGDVAGANLELARIHAGYPVLAGVTASDFRPQEDADWREALQRAGDAHTRTLLWRMVGLTLDPGAAAQNIYELEPTSPLIGLLVVRELARTESATDQNRSQTGYQKLEDFVARVAKTPGADRPWLMESIAGHLAAKRGDVELARERLGRARGARPDDERLAEQARASWALALAHRARLDSKSLDAVAKAAGALSPDFTRRNSVLAEVRGHLALALERAGRDTDAEFVSPDTFARAWHSTSFLLRMLARVNRGATPFDQFVLANGYGRTDLERELALHYILKGNFAGAAHFLAKRAAGDAVLDADPFLARIDGCLDCDLGTAAQAEPWTLRRSSAELRRLELRGSELGSLGGGDDAARAALDLGTALYNFTRHGNNRRFVRQTHQATWDTSAALRWYRRAYQLARGRELKAQAAFYAAKAERGVAISKLIGDATYLDPLPLPNHWYPVVREFADTAYHREILAGCGSYRTWAAQNGE